MRRNLITDYYDRLPAVIARCVEDPEPDATPERFSPGFATTCRRATASCS